MFHFAVTVSPYYIVKPNTKAADCFLYCMYSTELALRTFWLSVPLQKVDRCSSAPILFLIGNIWYIPIGIIKRLSSTLI